MIEHCTRKERNLINEMGRSEKGLQTGMHQRDIKRHPRIKSDPVGNAKCCNDCLEAVVERCRCVIVKAALRVEER